MKLAQIKGQNQAVDILKQAVAHKRLAHAYLFEGPDGVGKKTTALSLAQALNCRDGGADACLICPACHNIELGQHADVRVLRPEGQYIKIAEIRSLKKRLVSKAYEGRVKVQIIDEADKMNAPAANCLLKTLEEPPADSLLILVTAMPYNLPATIVSRCQRLNFRTLSGADIQDLLQDKGLNAEEGNFITSFCQGSMGQIVNTDINELITEHRELVDKKLSKMPLSDDILMDWAQELAKDAKRTERLLKWLLLWYRDLLVLTENNKYEQLINADKAKELRRQAARYTPDEVHQKLNGIQTAQKQLRRNANAQLVLEVMLMDL